MGFDILNYREKLDYNNKVLAYKTARRIGKKGREYIENNLFSNLFKGDEFLDDGIIRVLSFSGSWGMEKLFELMFTDDSIELTRWNIAAIAKHCSEIHEISWGIVLRWIYKMDSLEIGDGISPVTFISTKSSLENMAFIIPRYFYKISKLPKNKLIKTIKFDQLQCLYDDQELMNMFPCVAFDEYGYINARTEIKYSIETILGKVFESDRLFKGNVYIERILERLVSNETSILTPIGRSIIADRINQLSEEYYSMKLKVSEQHFDKWLDEYTLTFYDLLISGKINEYIISGDWIKEILSRCKPTSTISINKAFKILELEKLVDKGKSEFKVSTYSFEVFKTLIMVMNLEVIDILYDYLILKGINANQNIAANFILGISEAYFREYDYVYYYTKMCESIGHKWEELCRIISRYLYGDVIITHPRLNNGKIPDISVQNEFDSINKYSHLIECKRSFNIMDIEECILKYEPYCDNLEFWILEPMLKKEEETIMQEQRNRYLNNIKGSNKIKIMFFEDIERKIQDNTFLLNEMNMLQSYNQKITYTSIIKNQINQTCEDNILREKLVELLDNLVPYLNWSANW